MIDEHRKSHCLTCEGKDYLYDLCKFRKNIYSQNGEDGAIKRLLEILCIKTGWCCDIGAWDGVKYSNVYHLIEQGWKAVLVEKDNKKFEQLLKTKNGNPDIVAINSEVTSIDETLDLTQIPYNFELLNIDVDGDDYILWKKLKKYKPKIVIIELGDKTTLKKLEYLGKSKGYKLIAEMGNLIFLDENSVH